MQKIFLLLLVASSAIEAMQVPDVQTIIDSIRGLKYQTVQDKNSSYFFEYEKIANAINSRISFKPTFHALNELFKNKNILLSYLPIELQQEIKHRLLPSVIPLHMDYFVSSFLPKLQPPYNTLKEIYHFESLPDATGGSTQFLWIRHRGGHKAICGLAYNHTVTTNYFHTFFYNSDLRKPLFFEALYKRLFQYVEEKNSSETITLTPSSFPSFLDPSRIIPEGYFSSKFTPKTALYTKNNTFLEILSTPK